MRDVIWSRSPVRWAPTLIAALVLIVVTSGCGRAAVSFPSGAYTTTVPAEAFGGDESKAGYVGDWELVFTEEGSYTLRNKGVDIIRGSYAADSDRITLTHESGLFVESPGQQFIYTWALEQDKLQLRAVEDPIDDHKIVMSSQLWTPAR
jgi:hypothetical protein